MRKEKEIRLYSRERGKPQITITTENDHITAIRKDQRIKDFPLRMGWLMTNPKVQNDLKKWMEANNYLSTEPVTTSISISPLEFAMRKIPPGWKGKIR